MPEIYWYLFWVVALAWMIIFAVVMTTLIHRRNMKALEVVRLYAEKGLDPPPRAVELLAISEREQKWTRTPRGARLQTFMGMLFTACVAGGVVWWRIDEGGPQPVLYFFGAGAVFWGVAALGTLAAALSSSDK